MIDNKLYFMTVSQIAEINCTIASALLERNIDCIRTHLENLQFLMDEKNLTTEYIQHKNIPIITNDDWLRLIKINESS